jgi:hypothetical protein
MKIFVFVIGLACIILAIVFTAYGVKSGIIEKKMITNHYSNLVTGKKAVQVGLIYIIIGLVFFVGAILILGSWYLKLGQGKL